MNTLDETTEYQKRLLRILNNTEPDFSDDELWPYSEEVDESYKRRLERAKRDELFNEWRHLFNSLNVTLQREKKDGKARPDSIASYLSRMEDVTRRGFDPEELKKSRVDWWSSFREKKMIYYNK